MTTKQNEISERGRKRKRRERGERRRWEEKINLPKVERPRDWDEMKYDWYFIAARDIDPYIEIIDWIIVCRL